MKNISPHRAYVASFATRIGQGVGLKSAIFLGFSLLCVSESAAQEDKKFSSTGTGFFITHDGYALTANHVVEHCRGDIGLHGTQIAIKAKLVAADKPHDLAVLKIVPQMNIDNIAYFYTPQTQIKKGDPVVVIGYPRSGEDGGDFPEFTTNSGHVISTEDFVNKKGEKPLLLNNITEQGYSGGPVLDSAGNLVGVTLAGTCISEKCREGFARATSANVGSLEEKQAMDEDLKRHIDANMAASLPIITAFLAQNHVQYELAPAGGVLTDDRMAEIAEAIVQVRCPAREQDLVAGKGLMEE
ncbi:MAG: serine protease [Alphaproteobacteria bacterium]|nr:serine protease [Alphaproteobacteria bacterium]